MSGASWTRPEAPAAKKPGRGMAPKPEWSDAEVEVLRRMWPTKATTREIAAAVTALSGIERTRDGVISQARKHGLGEKETKFPDWSDEEKALLKEHWDDPAPLSQIAAEFFPKRNAAGLHRMGLHLGLETPRPSFQGVKTAAQIARQSAAQLGKQRAAAARAEARERRKIEAELEAKVLKFEQPPAANQNAPMTPDEQDARAKDLKVWAVEHEVVPLLRVSSHHCKWPIGEPGTESFGFCGRRPKQGGPYCIAHADVAFQSPSYHSRRAQEAKAKPVKQVYGSARR